MRVYQRWTRAVVMLQIGKNIARDQIEKIVRQSKKGAMLSDVRRFMFNLLEN